MLPKVIGGVVTVEFNLKHPVPESEVSHYIALPFLKLLY